MSALPEDIQTFIRKNFDSVEQLSVLAFLCSHDDRAWNVEELSRELRSSPASIRRRLSGLMQRHLVSVNVQGYAYDPSERIDAIVSRVLQFFRERPTTVIEVIFASGPDPLRSFADAFKLGGEDDT